MRCASIDVGSNSAVLLVAERMAGGEWAALHEELAIARLAEGLHASGRLTDGAIRRTESALAHFATVCGDLAVDRVVATGTAPFRRASNGRDAARRLGEALGARIDIISGEREAELALLATRAAFRDLPSFAVVDVGGASTELVTWGALREGMVSLDTGSVRLTEQFAPNAIVSPDAEERMVDWVRALWEGSDVSRLVQGVDDCVAIAGTATTLAAMWHRLSSWDASVVHGTELTRDDLDVLCRTLAPLTSAQRSALPGLEPKRADVIAAGAILLRTLVDLAGWPTVRVSDRGLRWGRLHAECDR